MRFSSSFKVGILTLVALFILLFTILWVKGRSFSTANRVEIVFRDVNGMRPGSGVQMMGLRVGQVEEIIPVVDGEESSVKLRFVITEPNITIPRASMISIQQSGLIGEQFLEITPPKTRTTYVPVTESKSLPYKDDVVQIKLDDKYYDVGKIKSTQVLSVKLVPTIMQDRINTKYAYKVDYFIDLPGLILPDCMQGRIVYENNAKKIRLSTMDGTLLPYPQQTSPYTIIEPMRISDFLDLQYKAAESLTETTLKVNELLSEEVIFDLKQSVSNINSLTAKANTTVAKAEKLVDSSKEDLDIMISMVTKLSTSLTTLSDNVNDIVGDDKFKPTFISATESIGKLANNFNKILDKTDSKVLANDLQSIMTNLKDISTFVSTMTKDDKLKAELTKTIENTNKAMTDISSALELVNGMTPQDKKVVEQVVKDVSVTACNLRKFSNKLNKRFLLFRLMF